MCLKVEFSSKGGEQRFSTGTVLRIEKVSPQTGYLTSLQKTMPQTRVEGTENSLLF